MELLSRHADASDPGKRRLRPVGWAAFNACRIEVGRPLFGIDFDQTVLPAETGQLDRAVSFTKGCYPGQEPVARLHFRGHPNRGLRVVALDAGELPAYDAELALDGKPVGRVTSAAADPELGIVALAYVRREVPTDATLTLGERTARSI
jgi:folate-binding protein YgfZ